MTIEELKEYCKNHQCFECKFVKEDSCMFATLPVYWEIENVEEDTDEDK